MEITIPPDQLEEIADYIAGNERDAKNHQFEGDYVRARECRRLNSGAFYVIGRLGINLNQGKS